MTRFKVVSFRTTTIAVDLAASGRGAPPARRPTRSGTIRFRAPFGSREIVVSVHRSGFASSGRTAPGQFDALAEHGVPCLEDPHDADRGGSSSRLRGPEASASRAKENTRHVCFSGDFRWVSSSPSVAGMTRVASRLIPVAPLAAKSWAPRTIRSRAAVISGVGAGTCDGVKVRALTTALNRALTTRLPCSTVYGGCRGPAAMRQSAMSSSRSTSTAGTASAVSSAIHFRVAPSEGEADGDRRGVPRR